MPGEMIPVAAQVNVPSVQNALQPLSSMLDIGKKSIDLQQAQQANAERIATQNFMQNPDNWQTDGRIDLDKINKVIPQIAPMTGMNTINNLTVLHKAETDATSAKQKLAQEQRQILSGPIGVLGRAGVTDPKQYADALDQVVQQNPNNPELARAAGAMKVPFLMAGPGEHIPKMGVSASQQFLSPSEQQSSLSPSVRLTDTGNALQETVTQPAVAGNAPSMSMTGRGAPLSMTPGANQHLVIINGKLYQATQDPASGNFVGLRPAENIQGAVGVQNPTNQEAAQLGASQQEVADIRKGSDNAGVIHGINSKILQLSKDTRTGPGTDTWQNALGSVAALWGGNVSNYQELGKFLEQNAIRAMSSMGGSPSDARLAAAVAANGSTKFNPQALQEVTRFNDAVTSAQEMYRAGMDKAVGMGAEEYNKLPAFKSAWAKNLDINIFRVQNAIRDGDTAELQKIKSELGQNGMSALATKYRNLKVLSATGRLPQ